MCNKPFYRLKVSDWVAMKLPSFYKKRVRDGGLFLSEDEYYYFVDYVGFAPSFFDTIPCGKCFGCLGDYQRLWCTRAMCESVTHKDNCFVTLTYNDNNLPFKPIINDLTGEVCNVGILVKDDFSAFIKRLRNYFPPFRFLCAGEYGDRSKRPHFHSLMFGLRFDDLQYFFSNGRKGASCKRSLDSVDYFISPLLSRCWGKGFCLVSRLTFENCNYVASYVNKSISPSQLNENKTNSQLLETFYRSFSKYSYLVDSCIKLGKIPSPFLHMSRRPGLGYDFIDSRLMDYYKYNGFSVVGGRRLPLSHCRYFDNEFVKRDLEFMLDKLKEKRKIGFLDRHLFDYSDRVERSKREEHLSRLHARRKPRDF